MLQIEQYINSSNKSHLMRDYSKSKFKQPSTNELLFSI